MPGSVPAAKLVLQHNCKSRDASEHCASAGVYALVGVSLRVDRAAS